MDAVDEGLGLGLLGTLSPLSSFLFPLSYTLGHGAVGQQHELLDELGGIVRLLEVGTRGLSRLVDVEVQFLAVELHGTVLEAPLAQGLRHLVEHDELGGVVANQSLTPGPSILLQYLLHLLVGVAAVAAYDGMCDVELLDVGLLV